MHVILLAVLLTCGQCESHRIVFSEPETCRCYVWIELPNGSHTQVPVINGYIPNIDVQYHCNEMELVLNYNRHIVYDAQKHGRIIRYIHNEDPPRESLPPIQEIVVSSPQRPEMPPLMPEDPPPLVPIIRPLPKPVVLPESDLRKPSTVPNADVRFVN